MDLTALEPGLVGRSAAIVCEENTALHMGSGRVEVFATPAMVALMEQAAINALEPHLPPGWQSVGVHIDVRHVAASPTGVGVRAEAELHEVNGRRLTFIVKAWDDFELIGQGDHERVVIDLESFALRLASKQTELRS